MRGLIVNADDFGLTPGINRAIVELYREGVVSSTTLMATAPAVEDAMELALAHPALGVGCHLNFVEGVPAAHPEAIPTLLGADGKTFRPSMVDFAQAVLRGTLDPAELALETQAQIQRLQRAGLDVTHVDTHKHTHVFPLIARTIVHIAQRCGVQAVRNPYEPHWSERLAKASLLRRGLLRLFRLSEKSFHELPQIMACEVLTTSGTLGIAGTGLMTAGTMRDALAQLPGDGTYEWCCHPGYRDAALDAAPTRLRGSREDERRLLLEVIPELLRSVDAPPLIHYGNLGVAGLQRASGQFVPNTGFEKVV
jgi:predicted glycoside hydrolase/deacetylase ChbG (UPF0249 family)